MRLDSRDAEIYGQHFGVVVADSPALLHQIYQLRYQVYCIEHQFENPKHHLAGYETDVYDCYSVHAALLHLASGSVCGCVRLILPRRGASLPIAKFLSEEAVANLGGAQVAEVSRYAVSKAFRRRTGEGDYPDVNFGKPGLFEPRRLMPHITLGLMLAVATLSTKYGVTHLAAVMAPALLRLLGSFGMNFLPAGSIVDHHGHRQPCLASVPDLLDGVRVKSPAHYEIIRAGLNQENCYSDILLRDFYADFTPQASEPR